MHRNNVVMHVRKPENTVKCVCNHTCMSLFYYAEYTLLCEECMCVCV